MTEERKYAILFEATLLVLTRSSPASYDASTPRTRLVSTQSRNVRFHDFLQG